MVRTLPSRPAIGDEPSNAPVCPLPPVAGPCSSRRDISLGLSDSIGPHAPRLYQRRQLKCPCQASNSATLWRPVHSPGLDGSSAPADPALAERCACMPRSIVLIGFAIPGSSGMSTSRIPSGFLRPVPRVDFGSCCPIPRCSSICRCISQSSSRSDDIGSHAPR
jgi:hypothetical protein